MAVADKAGGGLAEERSWAWSAMNETDPAVAGFGGASA